MRSGFGIWPNKVRGRVSQWDCRKLPWLFCVDAVLIDVIRRNKTGVTIAFTWFPYGDLRARLHLEPLESFNADLAGVRLQAGAHESRKQSRWMGRPLRLGAVTV